CPGEGFDANSAIRNPTSFDPVNPMYRVFGCCTIVSPTAAPEPVRNCTASFGTPAANNMSINFAAFVGESDAGFSTTVFPVTSDATTSPAIIAIGKFHGGMIAPTPSGMYTR